MYTIEAEIGSSSPNLFFKGTQNFKNFILLYEFKDQKPFGSVKHKKINLVKHTKTSMAPG